MAGKSARKASTSKASTARAYPAPERKPTRASAAKAETSEATATPASPTAHAPQKQPPQITSAPKATRGTAVARKPAKQASKSAPAKAAAASKRGVQAISAKVRGSPRVRQHGGRPDYVALARGDAAFQMATPEQLVDKGSASQDTTPRSFERVELAKASTPAAKANPGKTAGTSTQAAQPAARKPPNAPQGHKRVGATPHEQPASTRHVRMSAAAPTVMRSPSRKQTRQSAPATVDSAEVRHTHLRPSVAPASTQLCLGVACHRLCPMCFVRFQLALHCFQSVHDLGAPSNSQSVSISSVQAMM